MRPRGAPRAHRVTHPPPLPPRPAPPAPADKFVRLFSPDDSALLYPITGSGGDATTAQGNVSAVDVETPDLDAHPRFAGARAWDAILGPGDVLVIPRGWWHYVRSMTVSASINFWSGATE